MFSNEDILKFKIYCQSITMTPRPLEAQPHTRGAGRLWCEDWEIIEVLKYLFHGRELYLGDPPPNRLKNNPLWSQEDIIAKAEALKEQFKDADEIIEHLRSRRNGT